MATGSGFGKAILFGEHFVVYGNACIASGISKKTEVTLVDGTEPGFRIIDKRPAADGYIEKYADAQRESVELMNREVWHLDFDKTPVEVTIAGDLYCASGVGASAASCVAMSRAVSEHFDLGLSDEQINQCGLEGDKAYAGTPSGIDNTCSTYGGLIFFRKDLDGGKNTMEQMALGKPLDILLVSTGITTKTSLVVDGVRERKEKDPEEYEIIFEEAEKLVLEAKTALADGNLIKVGQLMDENHTLLQEIRVSHPTLDHLVDLTRDNGALGAKMTGGGMGGYMIALFADAETQGMAARVCKSEGYMVIRARIG